MLITKKFIRSLVEKYGRHTVYTDGSTWYHDLGMQYNSITKLFTFTSRENIVRGFFEVQQSEINFSL
jgi:hypothetical protein